MTNESVHASTRRITTKADFPILLSDATNSRSFVNACGCFECTASELQSSIHRTNLSSSFVRLCPLDSPSMGSRTFRFGFPAFSNMSESGQVFEKLVSPPLGDRLNSRVLLNPTDKTKSRHLSQNFLFQMQTQHKRVCGLCVRKKIHKQKKL